MDRVIYGPTKDDFLVYRDGSGGTVEIFDIQAMSKRRTGIGRKLVERLLKRLPEETVVFAITRVENEVAQQFYEALRFDTVNPLRRFYGINRGVDALMYLRLAGGPV